MGQARRVRRRSYRRPSYPFLRLGSVALRVSVGSRRRVRSRQGQAGGPQWLSRNRLPAWAWAGAQALRAAPPLLSIACMTFPARAGMASVPDSSRAHCTHAHQDWQLKIARIGGQRWPGEGASHGSDGFYDDDLDDDTHTLPPRGTIRGQFPEALAKPSIFAVARRWPAIVVVLRLKDGRFTQWYSMVPTAIAPSGLDVIVAKSMTFLGPRPPATARATGGQHCLRQA